MNVRVLPVVEVRYRRLLKAYPSTWRDRHGEALIGALLDGAEAAGRSAPTGREVVDLTVRGLQARAVSEMSAVVRGRAASISAGIAVSFSFVYFALFAAPNVWQNNAWGSPCLRPEPGPALVFIVWAVASGVFGLRLAPAWRAAAAAAVLLAPAALLSAPPQTGQGKFCPGSVWAAPDHANAAFLFGVAILAALGPISRRLMVRTALIAVFVFAIGFLVIAGWRDPNDQTLWSTTVRGVTAVPGTLQTMWGSGYGRTPIGLNNAQPLDYVVRQWAQGTLLRLNLVPVVGVALAVMTAAVLARRRKTAAGATLVLITCPFVAALVVAAIEPASIWFQ